MEKHIEENVNQHMLLMCSLVSKQQQQISTLKSALNKVTLNYSGKNTSTYLLHSRRPSIDVD
jgi:hypothetical protein